MSPFEKFVNSIKTKYLPTLDEPGTVGDLSALFKFVEISISYVTDEFRRRREIEANYEKTLADHEARIKTLEELCVHKKVDI